MAEYGFEQNSFQSTRIKIAFVTVFLVMISIWAMVLSPDHGGIGPAAMHEKLRIDFVNVGQGDAILIRTPRGRTYLVDGGMNVPSMQATRESRELVQNYLRSKRIRRLDGIVVTHHHNDHLGGINPVLKLIKTDRIWDCGSPANSQTYKEYVDLCEKKRIPRETAKAGDELEKKGLTFARGLRSILRHDPDKIMVGEIRDEETAQIAIQSALTGHLVFTTVHANNVIDVIGRFLNMGVEPYNFVSSLNCVLAQRLVRLLCATCKRPFEPTEQELLESGLRPEEHSDRVLFRNVGCDACNHTGYRGRTAIHELLDMSDAIREMIIERRPGSEIRRQAEKEGLSSLRESAVKKVFGGHTTLHEINRVTFVEEVR